MDPTAPFLVRRVLLGVLLGCTLVGFAFLGWVQYRTGQYHGREAALQKRYHSVYLACLSGGGQPDNCASRVEASCNRDPFWAIGQPFAFLPGAASDDQQSRCSKSVAD